MRTRILAIDPGKVRLGLAISDPDRRIGSPLTTYTRKTLDADGAYLKKLAAEERVGLLLVGLPMHLNGSEGEQAKLARVFGKHLEEWTGLPVRFWDERYTSLEADTMLIGAGLSRAKQKERRDRVAAQILLQSFLDAGCPEEI